MITEEFIKDHLLFETAETAQNILDISFPGLTVYVEDTGTAKILNQDKIVVATVTLR